MLEKYGIDPEHRPAMELPGSNSDSTQPIDLDNEASENLEEMHSSIESVSSEDASAIEKLKEELTSKLREAEVEISINRAKLSQQKAGIGTKASRTGTTRSQPG